MQLEKLTDDDIIAFVQYENGTNDYFKLSDEKAKIIKDLIFKSEIYKSKYIEYKKSFNLANYSGKSSNWKLLSVAAVLLITIFSYYIFILSSNDTHFSVNDFNLQMTRSSSEIDQSNHNRWIFELREGLYEKVLNEVENELKMSGSLIYASALILHGQETNNVGLLKQAKAILFSLNEDPILLEKLNNLIQQLEKNANR